MTATTPGRQTAAGEGSDPLIDALNHVGDAVRELVNESRRRDRRVLFLLTVVAALTLALGVVMVSSKNIADGNGEILDTIRDCTNEQNPGECYKSNQERTANYMRELLVAELNIAWCVKISGSREQAARCAATAGEPPR